jgi:RNA polymerase sigma-70 factor, ECF subfamily
MTDAGKTCPTETVQDPQQSLPETSSRVQPLADATCIAEVLNGNRERFSELIERYQAAVISVVRGYVKDAHQTEDIAQEIFVNAFTALPQLRDPKYFFPWLLQIARHRAIHAVRRDDRRPAPQPLSGAEAKPVPDDPVHEKLSAVMKHVEQLPEPYRHTVLLKYERDMSCKEIADQEGVAVGTITSRLTRALVMLRETISGSQKD